MAFFESNKRNSKWATRVTYLYLLLIVLSVLALVFIVVLTIRWLLGNEGDDSKVSGSTCTTAGCYKIASRILQNMNSNANPCDDFAQFACGSVYKKNPLHLQWKNALTGLDHRIMDVILRKQGNSDPDYFHLPKRLYEKCMATIKLDGSNILSYAKVLNYLDIPLLKNSSWNDNNTWSWQSEMQLLRKWGHEFNLFFVLDTVAITLDSKHYLRVKAPSSPTLDHEKFILLMARYFEPLAEDKNTLSQDLQGVSDFRRDLKETISENADFHSFFITIEKLQTYLDFMNVSEYISGLLPEGITEKEYERIVIQDTDFFKVLGQLLERHSNRTIANYIACSIIESLSDLFPHHEYRFVKKLRSEQPSSRAVKCKNAVRKDLKYVLTKLFVRQYHAEPVKNAASLMAEDIHKAYDRILSRTGWLDAATRDALKFKLHQMHFVISYTAESVNASYLSKLYGNVNAEDSYLGICSQLKKKRTDHDFSIINSVISEHSRFERFDDDALNENAMYVPTEQYPTIFIYLGILDQQFYIDAPEYINLATVGWIIAHEITHAFDSNNIRIDSRAKSMSFPKEFYQPYEERVQCLVHQFNAFQDEAVGLKNNGSLTITENIADTGGLGTAYEVYAQRRQRNSAEDLLPGLTNFTQDQTFWLAAAQFYCSNRPEDLREALIHSDVHSGNEFRIIGSFQNLANFSKDFQCKPGDKMNPEKRCALFQYTSR